MGTNEKNQRDKREHTGNSNEILLEIAQALNERMDVRSSLEPVLTRLVELMGVHSAWVFQYDAARRSFSWIGGTGLPPALTHDDSQALRCGGCECQERFDEHRLERAINLVRCSRLDREAGDKQGLILHASVPLRSEQAALGILNVAAEGDVLFAEDTLALLHAVGHQIAMALEREILMEKMTLRAQRFKALCPFSRTLANLDNEEAVLSATLDLMVGQLGYRAAGILSMQGEVQRRQLHRAGEEAADRFFTYRSVEERVALIKQQQAQLLEEAGSSLCTAIPGTNWQLRVESADIGAFDELDEQLLVALVTYVNSALDTILLRRETVAAATWAERRSLAADLHDAVSQRLFSASLLTETALLSVSEESVQVQQLLLRAAELLAQAQSEMRDVVSTLREVTDRQTVGLYIRKQAQHLTLLQGIRARARIESDPPLSAFVRDEICKIVDEALQNALRHGNPAGIWMTTSQHDTVWQLQIVDDGSGFDQYTVKGGIGLQSMQERASSIEGVLRVQSVLGRGTTITLQLYISSCSQEL